MNPKIELAEAERRTLEELSRNHPFRDYRFLALGVLALGKCHGLKLVSDILGVTAQSVRNWAKGWRKAGLKARGLSWKRTRLSLRKKRCPERFGAARDDLKHCQAAAREGQIALFYLDECGFANIPVNFRRYGAISLSA
jgi:hypothetical protein